MHVGLLIGYWQYGKLVFCRKIHIICYQYKIMVNYCKICGDEINENEFFTDSNKKYFLCSEECCKEYKKRTGEEDFIFASKCNGYDDCKELNNISDKCLIVDELQLSYAGFPLGYKPVRCQSAELFIIRTNMKLYNFVKESEEKSSKLNEETLELAKTNIMLVRAMFKLTIVSVFLVFVQIILQFFLDNGEYFV